MVRVMPESALITAPADEQPGISAVGKLLAESDQANGAAGPYRLVAPDGRTISLPESLVRVLRGSAGHLSRTTAVAVLSVDQELTFAEAADLLSLSLPQLSGVLARGELAYIDSPDGGRIAVPDLLAYKEHRDREEEAALDELVRQADELGLYV